MSRLGPLAAMFSDTRFQKWGCSLQIAWAVESCRVLFISGTRLAVVKTSSSILSTR